MNDVLQKTLPPFAVGIALFTLLTLLSACSRIAAPVTAIEPGDETVCALDGMLLKDFPGPKGQLHYADDKPDFFCDLTELFSSVLAPEQKRKVVGVFVQDMAKAHWDHPAGYWIDARHAVYVVGSKKRGSMGPTLASFSQQADAETFAKKEGGQVLRYEQIKPEMVDLAGGATRDSKM